MAIIYIRGQLYLSEIRKNCNAVVVHSQSDSIRAEQDGENSPPELLQKLESLGLVYTSMIKYWPLEDGLSFHTIQYEYDL